MFFKSINDTIYRNGIFRISIYLPTDDRVFGKKTLKCINVRGDGNGSTLTIDLFSRFMLGFHVVTDRGENYKESKIFFNPKQFVNLDNALTLCHSWLTAKQFDYLYKKNVDGEVYALGETPPYLPAVYKSATEWIRFYPHIVTDLNGVKCEGIRAESNGGPFYQWTCSDFLQIVYLLKNVMLNSYSIALQLLNIGVGVMNQINVK